MSDYNPDGTAAYEASQHQATGDASCSCGFGAWSTDHVAVMAGRAVAQAAKVRGDRLAADLAHVVVEVERLRSQIVRVGELADQMSSDDRTDPAMRTFGARIRAALAVGGDDSPGDGAAESDGQHRHQRLPNGTCATCDAHPAHPDLPEPQPCQPDCTLVHFHWHPDAPVCICPTCARRYAP